MSATLEVSGLRAGYHAGQDVVEGVDLRVGGGEAVALIGLNGAGKSTLVKALTGVIPVRGGEITFAGRSIAGHAADDVTRTGLVQVPEGRQLFGGLTVEENLVVGTSAAGSLSRAERRERLDQAYELFPRLRERVRQRAATMSGGEQQMLAVGRALVSGPRLLILDEPSLGLAPLVVRSIVETLGRLHADGLGILLVEQNAGLALSFCSRGYVLDRGRIADTGTTAELRERTRRSGALLMAE
jgi:branched-chain amino acid transport system ATP-binding protein